MSKRFCSRAVVSALAGIVLLSALAGCGKNQGLTDANAPKPSSSAGVPALPAAAPPVVAEQIKASQAQGQALQNKAARDGAAMAAARANAK